MKRIGATLSILVTVTMVFTGCATTSAPRDIDEKNTEIQISNEMESTEIANAPTHDMNIPAIRSAEQQRKIDDKKTFSEFSQLKFTSDSERAVHYFSMGQAYSLNNEIERAIEAYRTTLVYDPNSALVHSRIAAELVKIGAFAEAKQYCVKAVELDPKFTDGYLLLAGIQVVAKELDEALKTYERVLKIEPKNRDALLYFGTTLAEAGKLDAAIATLTKLVQLEEDANSQVDSAIAWYYLAKAQTQQDKFDDAAFSLRQSLKERPGFGKAAIFLADIYLAQEKQDKSIKVLEEAYKEMANPTVAARLAAYYLAQSQFAKAVPFLETVVEADPDNVSAKVRLALVYWQIQWLDKAYESLHEIFVRYPQSNEVAYYLGELQLERNHPEAALSYFKKISPEYARYEDAVIRGVASYQQMKKKEEARIYIESAIRRKSDIVSFYTTLARLFEEDNKVAHAIRVMEANRAHITKDENALYYLGYLYDRLGDKRRGLKVMEEILEKSPNNANALNYLGYTHLEENSDLKKAEAYIVRAVELKPNDPYILDSYGWLLFKQGKANDALKQIERAMELKPEEGVIIEHLADVYLFLNMKRKAFAAYEQALDKMTEPRDQARVNQKFENLAKTLGERLPASQAKSDPVPADDNSQEE